MAKLFTKGASNPKTAKGKGTGYETLILHLSPGKSSGVNLCASASKGCLAACLNTAGRGATSTVQAGRMRRTKLWLTERDNFKQQIVKELRSFVKRCSKLGLKPAVRMNGTSDIVWEKVWPELFSEFPTIQFYDYTKHYKRCLKNYKLPNNYHLTFSRSEKNDPEVSKVLTAGRVNVVAVFANDQFPKTYQGKPTYSAESNDLRFLDPVGSVGCLYAKGKAKKDSSGFVLKLAC